MSRFDLAETIGIICGVIVVLALIVLPMAANAFALRHRGINGRCALSVLITLGGTLIGGIAAKLTQLATANPFMLAIPAGFALACYVAGTLLAIIGLREIRRRRGKYRGGKRRAISMLVLNGVHFVVFAAAIYVGLAGWPSLARHGTAGKEVRSEEWNFSLVPPPEWIALAGATGNPSTRAMFVRRKPEMHLSVLAEKFAGAQAGALTAPMELIKAQIQSGGGSLLFDEPLAVNGCAGYRLESEEQSGAVRFFHVRWVYAHHETLYQVVAFGAPDERDFIRSETLKVLTGFRLLDPKRTAQPVTTTRDDSEFISEHYGYVVNLRGTPWTRRWETLAKDNPFAEFGMQNAGGNAAFVVIPVALGEVELDNNILARALAARVGVPFPSAGISGLKDWTQGPMEGQAFSFERATKEAAFVFRLRALSGRGCAYLLAAWADKRALAAGDFLEQALDRVRFSGKAPVLPRELEPRTDRDRLVQSLVANDLGLALDAAGHPDQALPWFLRAVKFNPREAPFLTNAVEMWVKFGRPADALALLDRSLPNFPDDQKLAVTRARILLLNGDTAGAQKILHTLIKAGWRDDAPFAEIVRTFIQRGQGAEALAAIDRFSRGPATPALQRLRALVFQARKEFDKAIALLLEARQSAPDDAETTLALAEVYSATQRHPETLAEYTRLLATRPDSTPLLQRKAAAEFALKRYRDAKATFELAIQKDPASAELKRILEHVSGLVAASDNSAVRQPIEPVAIPAALLAEGPPPDPEAGAAFRRIVRALEWVKGGECKSTEHGLATVRDEVGVARFSTIDFRFDPLTEEIFVNSLIVKNAQGEPAGTARVEDSYVVNEETSGDEPPRKILQVPVPGLQPGGTIEYTVTRRDTSAPAEFPYRTHTFHRGIPVARSSLFLKTPADSVKWEASPGLAEPRRLEGGLAWTVEAPPVPRLESFPAPFDTFLPTLTFGSPAGTWPAVANEYLAAIKDRLSPDAEVRAAAATAIAGLTGDAEKTAALARFVQKELAGQPGEFSRRNRLPHSAAEILRAKAGDSKDHALLLVQLLEAAAIPARLALVHTTATVRPGLPALDQFNHLLAFLPAGESGVFIDPTAKHSDLRKSPPHGLAASRALILDPERPRLLTIPDYSAAASSIRVKRDVTFPNETDADVRETAIFEGASAQSLRSSLLSVEAAQRNASVQQALLREVPGALLTTVRIDALDDPQSPLKIETRYLLRGRFSQADGQLTGRLPSFWESLFLRADSIDKRATPFRLLVPTQIETAVTLTPPVGYLCATPALRPIDNAFDRATASARIEANKLLFEVRVARRHGQFPAAQYRTFADAASAAIGLLEHGILLHKPGAAK